MNIFATDINPAIAAMDLDNKRVIKMVLESAQMLSTAINEHGRGKVVGPYKTTHKNHPANVWARKTRGNYKWLLEHFEALCYEYTRRYNNAHKCQQYLYTFTINASIIPNGPLTPFANCAAHQEKGISYKHIKPTTKAYQFYLVDRWNTDKRKPEWGIRGFYRIYPNWLRIIKNKYFHCKDSTWLTLYGENSNLGKPSKILRGIQVKKLLQLVPLILLITGISLTSRAKVKVNCNKHKTYCHIIKNKSNINKDYAMKLSNVVYKKTKKYKINPLLFSAILAQESMYKLNAKNCTKGLYAKSHLHTLVEMKICTDFGISQIHYKTAKRFNFEIEKLTTDLEYSVEAGIKVLADFQKRYSKKEFYWWTRYNSSTPTKREIYRQLVDRFL